MKNKHQELIAIVNENDEIINKAIRHDVHTSGKGMHRVACTLVFNKEGKLLLQKRSLHVEKYPNCWTVSSAGHVKFGDDYLITAIRELEEEIGIKVNSEDLKILGKLNIIMPGDNEIWKVYKVLTDQNNFKMQPEEVSEIKFVTIEQLGNMVNDPNSVICERARRLFKHFLKI